MGVVYIQTPVSKCVSSIRRKRAAPPSPQLSSVPASDALLSHKTKVVYLVGQFKASANSKSLPHKPCRKRGQGTVGMCVYLCIYV